MGVGEARTNPATVGFRTTTVCQQESRVFDLEEDDGSEADDGTAPNRRSDSVTVHCPRDATVEQTAKATALMATMVRASSGDHQAFADLYDATSRTVFSIVLRILRDPTRSQEVMQDVYFEAWQLAPRYDATRSSPCGWLAMIARRRAIDCVRSTERTARREILYNTLDTGTLDPVTRWEHDEDMLQALRTLSRKQRIPLVLFYYEGLSHEEVAEMLDIPLGTVKTRIRTAKRKLRTLFEQARPTHRCGTSASHLDGRPRQPLPTDPSETNGDPDPRPPPKSIDRENTRNATCRNGALAKPVSEPGACAHGMSYKVAADGQRFAESTGLRPGQLVARETREPEGDVHAIRPDRTETTVCGLPVSTLYSFGWLFEQVNSRIKCSDCRSRVEASDG